MKESEEGIGTRGHESGEPVGRGAEVDNEEGSRGLGRRGLAQGHTVTGPCEPKGHSSLPTPNPSLSDDTHP